MSETKKRYSIRLIGRIIIFILCLIMCFKPNFYNILNGMNFFNNLHPLHILWIIWIIDMILQIIPIKNRLALGSQKLFANHFKPTTKKNNINTLKSYTKASMKSAYKVFLIWTIVTIIIGALYSLGIINKICIFMISIFFYVCDLICVLVWCPFRLIMKNKCCTTCRIFNWDHIMMFAPLIFIGGFFSISLVVMAIIAWLIWELCILMYPERFCELTNTSLNCTNCPDKLCPRKKYI